VSECCLGEEISIVFHVLLSVLVGLEELELEAAQENGVAEEEVALNVVSTVDRVVMLLALHELSTDAAGILVAHLVNLNGVISAVEGHDEAAGFIIGLG
jgi:hypothetical protein